MTTDGDDPPVALPSGSLVLIAGDDVFELGYVTAVLTERGNRIAGPFTDVAQALATIEGEPPVAAIIAHHRSPEAFARLCEALRSRGVPCLALSWTRSAEVGDTPTLTSPFGAFQVAEWVAAQAPAVTTTIPPERTGSGR